jgi:AcrR family transcriptional regulator
MSADAIEPTRARRHRGSLSRQELIDAAYDVVARDGLDALSMPVLAREVGAGINSAYSHFRNKDDLLVALGERVTKEIYAALPPLGDDPWPQAMHTLFVEFRRVLHRFPVYSELFSYRPRFVLSRPNVLPVVLGRLESDVTRLVAEGLQQVDAVRGYYSCNVFVRGFVLLERGRSQREVSAVVEVEDPHGTAEAAVLMAIGGVDRITDLSDESFDTGLRCMIDGIAEGSSATLP